MMLNSGNLEVKMRQVEREAWCALRGVVYAFRLWSLVRKDKSNYNTVVSSKNFNFITYY